MVMINTYYYIKKAKQRQFETVYCLVFHFEQQAKHKPNPQCQKKHKH